MHAANRIVEKIERIPELFLFSSRERNERERSFLIPFLLLQYSIIQCYVVKKENLVNIWK